MQTKKRYAIFRTLRFWFLVCRAVLNGILFEFRRMTWIERCIVLGSIVVILIVLGFTYFDLLGNIKEQQRLDEQQRVKLESEALPGIKALSKTKGATGWFSAEFFGGFNGAFQGDVQKTFVVKDAKTGKDYLCIAGHGCQDKTGKKVTVMFLFAL